MPPSLDQCMTCYFSHEDSVDIASVGRSAMLMRQEVAVAHRGAAGMLRVSECLGHEESQIWDQWVYRRSLRSTHLSA